MRWLHISDIHVSVNDHRGDSKRYRRRAFLDEIKCQITTDNAVDCIIFTGDLFFQGKWNADVLIRAKEILTEIYTICSNAGGWNWKPEEPMARLFYCPGNHDLLREAYLPDNGAIIHRKDVLQNEVVDCDGYLKLTPEKKKLFTQIAFGLFDDFTQGLVDYHSYRSDYPFEYRVFRLCDSTQTEVTFVGINTALSAGKLYNISETEKELEAAFNAFLRQNSFFNTETALDEYKKYHIAVQKKLGNIVDDEKHLCFISEEAERALKSELGNSKLNILFGHHPCEFFSEDARNQFDNFVDQNNIYLYLCGHTHRADGAIIQAITNLKDIDPDEQEIFQVTVGGSFLDHSDYNQLSFSIGEVSFENGIISKSEVHLFTLIRDPLNNKPYWIDFQKCIKRPLDNLGESIGQNPTDPLKDNPESDIGDDNKKNIDQTESEKETQSLNTGEDEEKSKNSDETNTDDLRRKSIDYFSHRTSDNGS